MTETLFSLSEQIRRCTACPLYKKSTLAVPGEGPKNAKIMVVGEAPGEEEDRTGKTFMGKAGKFLDKMLEIADIKRNDVFITNAVKHRPYENRNPKVGELKTCKELWLDQQIEIIKPELIIVLGRIALKSLLNETDVKYLHGKVIGRNKQKYFVTYHPSAALRFPKIRAEMEKDFKKLKKFV